MSGSVVLNSRFKTSNYARRLWYKLVSTNNSGKLIRRMRKRGIEKFSMPDAEQGEKDKVIKSIITRSPQKTLDILNSQNIGIESREFYLEEIFTGMRCPLLKYAYASAAAENTVAPDGIIRSALNFDVDKSFKSRTLRFMLKTLFRWSFYVAGVALLDAYLLPKMISESEYFLGSRHFDYWEAAPPVVDLALGLGIWRWGSKNKIARKLEPYKLPVPLVGYWLGRSVKRSLQFSLQVAGLGSLKAAKTLYRTLAKYYRLRFSDHIIENHQQDLISWRVQKGLIDHWLHSEPAGSPKQPKAESLFRSIVARAIENKEKAHLAYIVNSLSYAQLNGLLRLLSDERICEMVSLLDKNKAAVVFSLLPAGKFGDFLASGRLAKEHEKAFLNVLSTQEAVKIFEKLAPDRAAELLPILPNSTENIEASAASVLFAMDPEKTLAILRNIRDRDYLAGVCIPALGTIAQAKILASFVFPKGIEKEIVEMTLKNMDVGAAIITFGMLEPKRVAELLALLPAISSFGSLSLSEIVNKMDVRHLFLVLREDQSVGRLASIFWMNLRPETKYALMKHISASEIQGGKVAEELLESLPPEQIALLLREIDHDKAVEYTSFLFSRSKSRYSKDKLKEIIANISERYLLRIIEDLGDKDLISVYVEGLSPEQRVSVLEALPPERAAAILGNYKGFATEEISRAAVAKISRAAALKILAKLSSQRHKIEFLRVHCGSEREKIFALLNDYVCEDGLKILAAFCEIFAERNEEISAKLSEEEKEALKIKQLYGNKVPGVTDAESRMYYALGRAHYNGISLENFKRFISFLNAEQFRNLVLTSVDLQVLTYAALEAPPSQLITLAEDYAAGRLHEAVEKLLFRNRAAAYLGEIVRGISYPYILEFFNKLPDPARRDILLALIEGHDKK